MNIHTKFFGEVEIKEESIIEFPNGLPGFEHETRFVLLDIDEQSTYHSLQSVEQAEIALIVTNPYLFFRDYEFILDDNTVNLLGIQNSEDVVILSVLTLKDPFKDTTANLQAPIVLNSQNNKAKQVILKDTAYETKHHIISNGKDV
ncbi:flagellar assembly protein FliW [Pontibacillus yanchengensis]|uniref:Flagellar assembly factor FliW n=1 Tax=Pontibacillus yanchengensis TaxID=462910 RepID=A0A6I5A110_9BACI|nr:flagellar assembly protein FliW [Pontibacillus yanchengensis]MYL33973.1 flagellar assembly protein FliW [Pontibacillus yanchengensis]